MTPYRPGDRIDGRYEVRQMRRGGMGVVYLCVDHGRGLPVAAKTLRPELLQCPGHRDRFLREARLWTKVERHPHIVAALSVDLFEGQPYIILEYVAGSDLRTRLSRGRLPAVDAVALAIRIAWAMRHAQAKVPGLVHRDLKPENVLLTIEGIPKVTDFGLGMTLLDLPDAAPVSLPESTAGGRAITDHRVKPGTPAYMSPEQCRSEPVDSRSDVYALGCLGYEMLSGRPLFHLARAEDWYSAHPVRPPLPLPEAPEPLRSVIFRCLAKAPEERYQSWDDVIIALQRIYEQLAGAPLLPPDERTMQHWELINQGLSYYNLGLPAEALDCYDRGALIRDEVFWNNRGNFLRALHRTEEALRDFETALALNQAYAAPWNNKGIALAESGRRIEARSCYDAALAIDPDDVDAWANKGADLCDLDRHDEALTTCEEALRRNPRHVVALNAKAKTLLQLGRGPEALTLFERILRINPWQTSAMLNKAMALMSAGAFDDALASIDRALDLDPRSPVAWAKRSQVLREMGRLAEAHHCFARAFAIDPEVAQKIVFKPPPVDRGSDQEDRNSTEWLIEGTALHAKGRPEAALGYYQRVVARRPTHTPAWRLMGVAMKDLGRMDDALACFDHVLAQDPDDVETLVEKGAILCDAQGQPGAALDLFARAAGLEPRHVHAWHNQAVALMRLRRWDEALPCLVKALELDAHHANAWFNQAVVLRALGRSSEAGQCLQRAAELGQEQALQALRRRHS